eukprot:44544-Amphidinium_carterae.2
MAKPNARNDAMHDVILEKNHPYKKRGSLAHASLFSTRRSVKGRLSLLHVLVLDVLELRSDVVAWEVELPLDDPALLVLDADPEGIVFDEELLLELSINNGGDGLPLELSINKSGAAPLGDRLLDLEPRGCMASTSDLVLSCTSSVSTALSTSSLSSRLPYSTARPPTR